MLEVGPQDLIRTVPELLKKPSPQHPGVHVPVRNKDRAVDSAWQPRPHAECFQEPPPHTAPLALPPPPRRDSVQHTPV